jgi:hypothetical protein
MALNLPRRLGANGCACAACPKGPAPQACTVAHKVLGGPCVGLAYLLEFVKLGLKAKGETNRLLGTMRGDPRKAAVIRDELMKQLRQFMGTPEGVRPPPVHPFLFCLSHAVRAQAACGPPWPA